MSTGEPLDAHQVMGLFNQEFAESDTTELIGGAAEPYYQPGSPHGIYFRADYVRSALHEVAHWCVAGRRRRRGEHELEPWADTRPCAQRCEERGASIST